MFQVRSGPINAGPSFAAPARSPFRFLYFSRPPLAAHHLRDFEITRLEGGVCVSTVNVVRADRADGADGVCERRMHPDDPASGAAFTAEGDLDAQCPQERLRAPQATSERAGIFRPAGTAPR